MPSAFSLETGTGQRLPSKRRLTKQQALQKVGMSHQWLQRAPTWAAGRGRPGLSAVRSWQEDLWLAGQQS